MKKLKNPEATLFRQKIFMHVDKGLYNKIKSLAVIEDVPVPKYLKTVISSELGIKNEMSYTETYMIVRSKKELSGKRLGSFLEGLFMSYLEKRGGKC